LLAIVGNNYPVYYRFRGGLGYSALLGAIFVINWIGVFVSSGAAMVLDLLQ
jgi:glycerol-3-phosphate acyltransferase PlsY